MITRRSLFTMTAATLAMPSIVRASSIMSVVPYVPWMESGFGYVFDDMSGTIREYRNEYRIIGDMWQTRLIGDDGSVEYRYPHSLYKIFSGDRNKIDSFKKFMGGTHLNPLDGSKP